MLENEFDMQKYHNQNKTTLKFYFLKVTTASRVDKGNKPLTPADQMSQLLTKRKTLMFCF